MADPTLVFPETLKNLAGADIRLYPEVFGYVPGREHDTDIERAFDGSEQTRARFDIEAFGLWQYNTVRLDPRQAYFMRAFLRVARGRATKFWFTKPDEEWWDVRTVGHANGTTALNLNVRDAYLWDEIQVDGTGTADYNVITGGGTYGQDRIDWTASPPGNGALITMHNFWGREVSIARMDSDKETFVPFAGGQDAVLGVGPQATPRLFVQFQLQIRGTR